MAFSSEIRPGETIIDDFSTVSSRNYGRVPRDYSAVPYGSHPFAQPFDLPLIPRNEWVDRIEEMERTKTRLSDLVLAAGLESLNQGQTNYCWCNAVITASESIRCYMGQPHVKLSAASVAAPIKDFRNEGGWGGEALEYIVEHGIVPVDLWPANAINRKYDTPEADAEREKYKISEWYDVPARDFDALMTLLFLRIPVACGYNWWGHETCAFDPIVLDNGKFGTRQRNSWGNYDGSDRGFFLLNETKSRPDDAVAPRQLRAAA